MGHVSPSRAALTHLWTLLPSGFGILRHRLDANPSFTALLLRVRLYACDPVDKSYLLGMSRVRARETPDNHGSDWPLCMGGYQERSEFHLVQMIMSCSRNGQCSMGAHFIQTKPRADALASPVPSHFFLPPLRGAGGTLVNSEGLRSQARIGGN